LPSDIVVHRVAYTCQRYLLSINELEVDESREAIEKCCSKKMRKSVHCKAYRRLMIEL
jgi:hypothetical protein